MTERYGAYYFSHGCGRPYRRDPEWLALFAQMAERIVVDINPGSVLDAGCAMGFLVEALRERGVAAEGIDISQFAINSAVPALREHLRVGSLTEPLDRRYDLIVCIEVLEHLNAADGDAALENICGHTDDCLFSSTPVDFKEATHLNVRSPGYWAAAFARRGLYRDVDFDASFVTPWAARFRRTGDPTHRVVSAYEERLWALVQELDARRELTLEQRDELARAAAEAERMASELAALHAARAAEAAAAAATLEQWQRRWAALGSTPGGRLLRHMQRARGFFAPPGSKRDAVVQRLLGGESDGE